MDWRNNGKINGVNLCFSDHAVKRMLEMGVTGEEVRDILTDPDSMHTSQKYPDSTCYTKGDYTLAVRDLGKTFMVTTVLYSTRKAWLRASLDGKLPEDRPYRDNEQLPRW